MNGKYTHATVVAIGGAGVALIGPSGSGKSDLALRLIDRGAELVCDDYVAFEQNAGRLWSTPALPIAGKIEICGIGIVDMPHVAGASLRLCTILGEAPDRMPQTQLRHRVANFDVPMIKLLAFHASAPIRVEYALQSIVDADVWPVPCGATQVGHRFV